MNPDTFVEELLVVFRLLCLEVPFDVNKEELVSSRKEWRSRNGRVCCKVIRNIGVVMTLSFLVATVSSPMLLSVYFGRRFNYRLL